MIDGILISRCIYIYIYVYIYIYIHTRVFKGFTWDSRGVNWISGVRILSLIVELVMFSKYEGYDGGV